MSHNLKMATFNLLMTTYLSLIIGAHSNHYTFINHQEPVPYGLPLGVPENGRLIPPPSRTKESAHSVSMTWSVANDHIQRLQAELTETQRELAGIKAMHAQSYYHRHSNDPQIPRMHGLENKNKHKNETLFEYAQNSVFAEMQNQIDAKNEELRRKDALILKLGNDIVGTSDAMRNQLDTVSELRRDKAAKDESIIALNTKYLRELTHFNRNYDLLRQQTVALEGYRNSSRFTIQRLQTQLDDKAKIIQSMHEKLENERQRKDAALEALWREQQQKQALDGNATHLV